MKKILYMLLCLFLLVGCTHQNGGNTETTPSTTTSNTDLVVTQQIIKDTIYKISDYECTNWVTDNVDSRIELTNPEASGISETVTIALYPDTKSGHLDWDAIPEGYNALLIPWRGTFYSKILIGYYEKVENNIYQMTISTKGWNQNGYTLLDKEPFTMFFQIDNSDEGIYILGDSINNERKTFCPLNTY